MTFCKIPDYVRIEKDTLLKLKVSQVLVDYFAVSKYDSMIVDGPALRFLSDTLTEYGSLKYEVKEVLTPTPIENLSRRGRADGWAWPVVYTAKRVDNGEIMQSRCIYGTTDGKIYLSVNDAAVSLNVSNSCIYSAAAIGDDPIFVEVDPLTMKWSVEEND